MRLRHLSLACLTLLVAACGRPALTGAAPKAEDAARVMAAARSAGEAEVVSWNTPALAANDTGLEPTDVAAFDRNGDGKLDAAEQLGLYRAVWDEMGTLARGGQTAPVAPPTGPADYHPPYNTAYTPTKAEIFFDAEEILPAVVQTLQSAQRTIRMDLFMLGGSQGQKLAELLVAKAKAGVDVRILHDPGFGLAGEPHTQIIPVMRYLLDQGIRVKPYPLQDLPRRYGHPLANATQIDHDKFLVVDEQVAMVGSMNLIDVGVMNHDAYFRLTGDVATELAATHDATWRLDGPALPDFGKAAPPAARYGVAEASEGQARILKTDIDRQTTRQGLLDAIAGSRKSVHVLIFEFGDPDVAAELVKAARRGVDVRVIADPNASYDKYFPAFKKVKLHGTPNLLTTNILREAGVPVKWYVAQAPHQEMHMKAAVIDHERVILGSTNFTYQAFHTFRETSADVVSPAAAARWEDVFQKDWEAHAKPVLKQTYLERVITVAVKGFDKINLSWW
ncbi:MAG: phosphatidylserine/phosphatidylglycerophosphate/cardiolipin synthase [Cyanobacteria bacterium RYN_339]|nr:phosphatidylserine/phosphatidylglycerophosphate/cardiolipin synthase [Cyanobacteria bacterium RYN_339]